MNDFEIILYSRDDGAQPVYDFIRSLEVKRLSQQNKKGGVNA
jgi:hypothetical protein